MPPRITLHCADPIVAADGVVVTADMGRVTCERIFNDFSRHFPGVRLHADTAAAHVDRLGQVSSYPLFGAVLHPGAEEPPLNLVIKFAPVFDVNNEGLTEYRHLQLMHQRLDGRASLRVPRPLDFFPDLNALVMERVGGRRFSGVILAAAGRLAPAADADRLQQSAQLCGEWLAAYHDATRAADSAPFDGTFLARVEEKLVDFRRHGFPDAVADEVARSARLLHEWGSSRRVRCADQHGDYGPQNVHVGDGCVYVFDLNYNVAAPVYEDVDYFLVTLETMNPYPRQWLFDRARVAAMREPFLTGYFAGAAPDPERELCLEGYYLKSLLFRCAKQRRNTTRRGRAALAGFDALRLRGWYAQRLRRQCELVQRWLGGAP